MAAFEYPPLARLDFKAKARFLSSAALDPARLPMNRIDVDDRQTGALAHLAREGAFTGAGLADDHDTLHITSLLMAGPIIPRRDEEGEPRAERPMRRSLIFPRMFPYSRK